jgi:hypothetical protein
LAGLSVALIATGCVVQQTRSGQYQFGIDADALLGSKLRTFNSVQGPVTIRRNSDGSYGMRLENRLQVLRLGRFDDLQVVQVSEGAENTAVVLRTARDNGNCPNYRLVNISRDKVGEVTLQNRCNEIDIEEAAGKLAMRQSVEARARWWHWEDGRFSTSVERPAPRQPARQVPETTVAGPQPSGPKVAPPPRPEWRPPTQNVRTSSDRPVPRLPPPPSNAERTSVEIVRVNLVDEEPQ